MLTFYLNGLTNKKMFMAIEKHQDIKLIILMIFEGVSSFYKLFRL